MARGDLPFHLAAELNTGRDAEWHALNAEIGGRDDWPALAIKAAYVFGVLHDICESVDCLVKAPNAWPVTYLSAFGVCASGIELLGRCLNGDEKVRRTAGRNLKCGFEWLISSSPKDLTRPSVVTITSYGDYEVEVLVALRHFAAHGQAITQKPVFVDIELLDAFPQLIGNAMERYWSELQNSATYCEKLAAANVLPLRSTPVEKMWNFFGKMSAGGPFYQFDWRVRE